MRFLFHFLTVIWKMLDITPKRCCVKYDPPMLVLYYETSKDNIRKRTIPIKDLPLKEGNLILKDLYNSHHKSYLEKFSKRQIVRVLNILIEKNDGINITYQENDETIDGINIKEDNLNQLDDVKLNEVKKHMNSSFEQNQVKPGDQNWQYDIEVDFENAAEDSGALGIVDIDGIESAGWDEESDMEF